jgi:tripartite-type tricarboxylate transporter receptor subunit TctC
MRTLHIAVAIAIVAASSVCARAQTFPNKPVTIVVPFAAGGPIDTLTRIVGERMKQTLGQPILIDNVGGAAGSIAAGRVARAAPDGYTLMTALWGTHVANAAIYNLTYDVEKDFEPVALISSNALLIVGRKALPANTLAELVAWLKANPGKASQGTSGAGSVGHIGGAFFQKETGTQFQFVPYRGLGPAMQDLMAGNIDLMFDTPATSLPQVAAGSIRAYAITSKTRLPAAADIPTVDEAGLPGLHISTWTAFFAPKGTPKAIVDMLSGAVSEALADPSVVRRLTDIGQEIFPRDQQTPQALAALQKAELAKWTPIIKAAGIRPE